MLILTPVNHCKSVFESKSKTINTSCCYLELCQLLWAIRGGESGQGAAGAMQGEIRKWDWRRWLSAVLQTAPILCLPLAWQATARGEFAVVLQPHCQCWLGRVGRATLDQVDFVLSEQGQRGNVPWQLPALGDWLCCWRWGDSTKTDISWDRPVGHNGVFTGDLF